MSITLFWPIRGLDKGVNLTVYCWAQESLLPFCKGTDLETILVKEVAPLVLFEAIKLCYEDAGHPLNPDNWAKALMQVDEPMRSQLPTVFPEDLSRLDLDGLGDGDVQRAFLFALLHGPHSCKAVKDMRTIGENLTRSRAMPATFGILRRRLVTAISAQGEFVDDNPYLFHVT